MTTRPRSPARPSRSIVSARLLLFPGRKSKHEKRLFICERRLRNPHAPRFSRPKAFRGAVTQYVPSRAYRLVTGSLEVRKFHSYVVDFHAIIFYVEIVSGHDSAPKVLAGALTSLCHRRQGGTTAGDQWQPRRKVMVPSSGN